MPETAYDAHADAWAYIGTLMTQAISDADTLHVIIPNIISYAHAEILTLPPKIRDGTAVVRPISRDGTTQEEAPDGA